MTRKFVGVGIWMTQRLQNCRQCLDDRTNSRGWRLRHTRNSKTVDQKGVKVYISGKVLAMHLEMIKIITIAVTGKKLQQYESKICHHAMAFMNAIPVIYAHF